MRLLHWEGAAEEKQLILPVDNKPTESLYLGWILSQTISLHDFPLRLATVPSYGFVSGNSKNRSGIGNF